MSIAQDDGQTSARIAAAAGKDCTSMKIIALITAAYLPGTFVAVSWCVLGSSRSMLIIADPFQHGNVRLAVVWHRWFKQSSFTRPLDLLGSHGSVDSSHLVWMGDLVEIGDVSL